ncbi:hypothetical protein HRI_003476900 [Hibiscus trionum]|nr:hypothetical protein HRI_003476900 [Hibiscus trionum]
MSFAGRSDMKITKSEDNRRRVPSASSTLVIGCMLGILQTLFLISTAKAILHYMGVKHDSPMLKIAQQYLTLRSLGAPAILLSLAAQGFNPLERNSLNGTLTFEKYHFHRIWG